MPSRSFKCLAALSHCQSALPDVTRSFKCLAALSSANPFFQASSRSSFSSAYPSDQPLFQVPSRSFKYQVECIAALSSVYPSDQPLFQVPSRSFKCQAECTLFQVPINSWMLMMMIAFITLQSGLVPLIEGLCAQIHVRWIRVLDA